MFDQLITIMNGMDIYRGIENLCFEIISKVVCY
jgi:hypothetical protein